MIKLFLKWLKEIIKISDSDMYFEIYTHENLKIQSPKQLNIGQKSQIARNINLIAFIIKK